MEMKRSIRPPVILNEISYSGMVQSTGNDGSFIAECLYFPKDMCTMRRQYLESTIEIKKKAELFEELS